VKIEIFDVEDKDGVPLECQLEASVEPATLESENYDVADAEEG
jgi:hypothetical protein